jgi:hypothetical protein
VTSSKTTPHADVQTSKPSVFSSGSGRATAPTPDGTWSGDVTVPDPVMRVTDLNVYYGNNLAVRDVTMDMARSRSPR